MKYKNSKVHFVCSVRLRLLRLKTTCIFFDIKMPTKAEKKLAKQLAREQLSVQIKKDTLVREEGLDQITLSKIKDKWFETLIDTKVPEMRDNLRHILHYMEKLIEAENFRKLLFEDERQESEEQTTLMAKSHGSALETLYDIYQKRIQYLKDAYNEAVSEKKTEADTEFRMINYQEKVSQENMNMILFQMQKKKEKVEDIMNCDMRLKIDDEHSKNKELLESLQTKLEKKMESRWEEITATLSRYEENTHARTKEYIKLKTKDDKDSEIIYLQMKKMKKLFEQLDELKRCNDECEGFEGHSSPSINDLREERMKVFNTFKLLKVKVEGEFRDDENNLRILTVTSNNLTDKMKKIRTKGEQILTLFRICLRLETEYEKVIPVGNPLELSKIDTRSHKRRKTKIKQVKDERNEVEKEDDWLKNVEIYEKFWRKMSKVRLSIMALEKCIETAKKKNRILKQVLAAYLKEFAHTKQKFAVIN